MPKGVYRTELILEALRSGDKDIEELYQAVYPDHNGFEHQLATIRRKYPKHGRYRSLRVLISLVNRDKVASVKSGTRIDQVKKDDAGHYGPRVKYHLIEPEGDV
jgi:hypothetical protein